MLKKTKEKEWSASRWRKESWKWFSIYIRLTYANFFGRLKCYTCNKVGYWKGDGFQAGHFQGGRGNSVLLDEKQVRPQCYSCNCCRSGEQYIFGKNLEKEYGVKAVEKMKHQKHETVKITKKEWMGFANLYKEKATKLSEKKGLSIN